MTGEAKLSLKGGLYLVATPIGNLGDITLRALEILRNCDVIACEDTRVSRKLLSAYSIDKPLISYHDHNADQMRPLILDKIAGGQAVVLISDAGTPLISDPGYKLVRQCYEAKLPVTFLPGPSAVIAGLVLSGMASDRFLFAGFADRIAYPELSSINMTLIFFESAKRLGATLKDMAKAFPNREVSVVREITKLFEEVRRGSFDELIHYYEENGPPKGEVVLVLSPKGAQTTPVEDVDHLLRQALASHSIRDACTLVAGTLGVPRKQIYQRALELKGEK
jgi:16S rRNA (cytidine1402-2'-O)-methyltransferase